MADNAYNFITFEEGIDRINECLGTLGIDARLRKRVTTSRDPHSVRMRGLLRIENLPTGVSKWQLPVYWEGTGAQFFLSIAAPNTKIEEHAHIEGDGLRFIVGGSVTFNGIELGVGDWMFIPQGVSYSLDVGDFGATMCYCYQCCCVIRP